MTGKGDRTRVQDRRKYHDNFNLIEWGQKDPNKKKETSCKSRGKTIKYY